MNNQITQGSIISYTRSLNYPNLKCMGVIISARCDLANKGKIKNMHWLTAITLDEWIYEVEFYEQIYRKEKELLNAIKNIVQPYNLNIDVIQKWGPEISEKLFEKSIIEADHKRGKDLMQKCEQWKMYEKALKEPLTISEKKQLLKEQKINFKKILSELQNGGNRKFCFIPRKAYDKTSNSSVDGLIVDIYDIHQIPIICKEKIEMGIYDYQTLLDPEKRNELNRYFYFQSQDDYILQLYKIESPWTEYLLQHFSNAFSRIGVENASDEDIEIFCSKIVE